MHTDDIRSSPYAWLLPAMTMGLIAGIVLARSAHAWALPAAALTMSLAAALLLPGRRRFIALTLASAALGGLLTIHACHPVLPPEGEYVVSGVVLDEITIDDAGHMQTLLGSVTLNGTPVAGKAWYTTYLDEDETLPDWFQPGLHVTFTGQAYHPRGRVNPGGFDFRLHLLSGGVPLGVYGHEGLTPTGQPPGLMGSLAGLRHRLTRQLMDLMGPEAGSLAAATLLGTKDYLPLEDYAAFKDLGIVHILSVSGYHVGVLILLMRVPLSRLPRLLMCAGICGGLALYAMITGSSPPVIRAVLLVMLFEGGYLQQRHGSALHLLSLSAALQLLINPLQLFSASFLLTYSAMLGLVLVRPRLARLYPGRASRWRRRWHAAMAVLSAQLGMLPVQMYFFGGFPPAAFLVNILIVGIFSGVMMLYWALLLLLPVPGLRDVLGAAAGWITEQLLALLRFLAKVLDGYVLLPAPDWLTFIGWVMLLLGLSLLLAKHRVRLRRMLSLCGAVLVLLSMIRLPHTDTAYLQFSEGEADAAILHDRNAVIVVDTGETSGAVATYLMRRGLPVDLLILTHLHIDHTGGVRGLLDCRIPIRACAVPEGALTARDADEASLLLLAELEAAGTQIIPLSRGDVIDLPSGTLTVLWPQKGAVRAGQSANDASLVLLADVLGTTMLLAADLTSTYEMYAAIPADVLKAAHHGSSDSTTPAFLGAVSPQVILLSCGTEDREAAFIPRAGDIPVYSTHASGAVTIRFTDNAFTVDTFLPR